MNDSGFIGTEELDRKALETLGKANAYSDGRLSDANDYTDKSMQGLKEQTAREYVSKEELALPGDPAYKGYALSSVNALSAQKALEVDWAAIQDKPGIPAKTSELENDSGYLTETQIKPSDEFEGYAQNAVNAQDAVNAQNALKAQNAEKVPWTGIQDRPDVALRTDIPTKTSELGNDSGYVTEDQLGDYVKFDDLPDLSGYAGEGYVDEKVAREALARQEADAALQAEIRQKAPLSAVPTKTSDLVNDSGYLTEHQSLSDYYTKSQTDEKIQQKQDAYELLSRNDRRKIEGDGLVYALSAGEWIQTGELALKSDISANQDSVTKEYVDEKVTQEALARQEADQELRAQLGEKANLDQVPTKTSQLNNDSGFIGTEVLQDYYTKTQTDEKISSAVSAKDDAKYIESEDGNKRIYGDGDVSALVQAPGTYGPWTDPDGNTRTDLSVKLVDPDVPTYVWADRGFQFVSEGFHSLEAAETALTITQQVANVDWTRTYAPGQESWKKEGEVAVRYGRDFGTLSASRLEVGEGLSVIIDKNGMKTATAARIGFGQASDSGVQQVVLSPSNDGGIVLDGVAFALAPIYVDEPYKYDQKTRVATLGDVDSRVSSQMSAYVSKTEVVPYTMIPGYAANAYEATKATFDGAGNEIESTYASKNDLTAKQDKLPVNLQTGIYDISAWGAAQAAYVPWSGVEDKQIASATEPGIVKVGANLTIDADGTLNAVGGGGSSPGGHTLTVKGFYKYGSDNPGHVYVDGLDVSYSVDSFNMKPLGLGNTVPDLYLSEPELKFYNQTMFFRNGRCVDDKGSSTDVYGYTLLTADTTVSVYSFYCLAAGTKIRLVDGS